MSDIVIAFTTSNNLLRISDFDNTGLSNPGALSPHVGDYTTTSNGEVIENLNISGLLTIAHDNVEVSNCRVYGSTFWSIHVDQGTTGVNIHDCDLGKDIASSVIGVWFGGSGVVQDSYFHHCSDGIRIVGSDILVLRNKMTDMPEFEGSHNDVISMFYGDNVLIEANYMNLPDQQTSCIFLSNIPTGDEDISNVDIKNNIFNGGAYTLYCSQPEETVSTTTGVYYENNQFLDDDLYGYFYPAIGDAQGEFTQSGNVNYTTGAPIILSF